MQYVSDLVGKQYVPGIYIIESRCGKVYVGSAVSLKTRYMTHRRTLQVNKHDNQRLQNHYNKYGPDSLTFRVVEGCFREQLIEREQFHIDKLNPFFNIARVAGATYGLKPWLNKRHSEETKRKIKQANLAAGAAKPKKIKAKKLTQIENINRFANLNKTEEGRKRCSSLHKGNTYWLGKKHKPETIANRMGSGNPNSKKVYCVELDKWFDTGLIACSYFGLSRAAIGNAIRRGHKVLGKYTMQYEVN